MDVDENKYKRIIHPFIFVAYKENHFMNRQNLEMERYATLNQKIC